MKTSTFATAAAILSISSAATVTLETTKCLNSNVPLQQLEIEMNLSGPVARDLPAVCGLRILSASEGVDINTITCQAFKDVVGTQPGSAVFTYAQPALIATNPVSEKAIWCKYPTSSEKMRRQNNETVSSSSLSSSASASASASASVSTVTLSASSEASSAARSTVVSTTIVSASSGFPSPSGNLTLPSTTLRPSASQTSQAPQESTGAAGKIGAGVGVVAGAFVAMFV